METRNLGRSGLRVSEMALGSNNFGPRLDLEGARAVIEAAIDRGITLIDTANTYGAGKAEEFIGEVLGPRRKNMIVATKFGMGVSGAPDTSRRAVIAATENALRRLNTDWIDLLQLHRLDPRTPIEETLRALDDLISAGKVRYIGCSNFSSWRLVEAIWASRAAGHAAFVSAQEEYSLVRREVEFELLPPMDAYGIGLLAYAPLARGMLLSKYQRNQPLPPGIRLTSQPVFAKRYLTDENFDVVEQLDLLSKESGVPLLTMALSWLRRRAGVSSVVVGAMTPQQLNQNVEAFVQPIPPDVEARIETISTPRNMPRPKGD